jgi:hypothetical protein
MTTTFATSAVIIATALFFAMTHYRVTLAAKRAERGKERAKMKGNDAKLSADTGGDKRSVLGSFGWHRKREHKKDTEVGTTMEMP